MKAYITIGGSASGKSSWANAHAKLNKNTMIVERDRLRVDVFRMKRPANEAFSWSAWKWKWEDEVTRLQREMITTYAAKGYDLIISDTNLHKGRREALAAYLQTLGYEVEYKNFPVTYFEAVKRDIARPNPVGPWVIAEQQEKYLAEFGEGRAPEYDPELPDVVLCDIDGTAALMRDRSPYEWSKVGQDAPNEIVWAMLSGLVTNGLGLIFVSGRDGSCEDQTAEWLMDQGSKWIPSTPFGLYMRAADDMRSDVIVKREIYDREIRGKYNVTLVIDDRPKVAQMWRELGLTVVQVGNPYIDF